METYTETDDPEEKAATLNLITHVEVEKANQSDAQAVAPAIEDIEDRSLKPDQILADTGYGSDENVEKAMAAGIDLVSPVAGKDTESEI
ncbi:MAG: transposase, partial [Candidatus Adiutrix sp.]|nr:transposase [Candidatus Adiutrix sp.]